MKTKKQRLHRKLMTLFSKLGIDDDTRHHIIWQYTGGRTFSTKELNENELIQLINRMQEDREDRVRRLRSTILDIATRTGIHDPSDWEKFNRFMLIRSVLKKPFPEYSYKELKQLLRQFRGIEAHNKRAERNPANMMHWRKKGIIPSKN